MVRHRNLLHLRVQWLPSFLTLFNPDLLLSDQQGLSLELKCTHCGGGALGYCYEQNCLFSQRLFMSIITFSKISTPEVSQMGSVECRLFFLGGYKASFDAVFFKKNFWLVGQKLVGPGKPSNCWWIELAPWALDTIAFFFWNVKYPFETYRKQPRSIPEIFSRPSGNHNGHICHSALCSVFFSIENIFMRFCDDFLTNVIQ